MLYLHHNNKNNPRGVRSEPSDHAQNEEYYYNNNNNDNNNNINRGLKSPHFFFFI